MSAPPAPACSRHRRALRRTRRALALLGALTCLAPTSGRAAGAARLQDMEAEQGEQLLVLAASSLTDVLPRLAELWEVAGGAPVVFSFDATSRLAPQAVEAAFADLFFAADEAWIRWLEDRGMVDPGEARVVAGNELVVVVPAGSAAAPAGPAELATLERLALAGTDVPAGRYARMALEASGVWAAVEPRVVRGGSVRGVLEWVARGEAPAGVVYATDAAVEPDVQVAFALPPETAPGVEYWAAPLVSSRQPTAARAFLELVQSPEGQAILQDAGFTTAAAAADARGGGVAGAQVADADAVASASLPSVASAVRLSLEVALLATLLGLLPAVALGWLLARRDFPGKTLLSTAILVPLVIPPVVTGFLLLSVLGVQGPLGRVLSAMGVSVPFTLLGATIAALVVGLPLYVISIRGAFEAVDPLYEDLSLTLGVPPRRTFLRISLPLALPGVAAGAVLAFARALGEFGATIVLAGNVEGQTRTIALAVYTLLESPAGRESTWVLVGASVALSVLALLGFETLLRRQRRRFEERRGA